MTATRLGNSATSSCKRRISLSVSCSFSRFSMSGSIDYLLILTRGKPDFGASDERGWRRVSNEKSVQPLQEVEFRELAKGVVGIGPAVGRGDNAGDAEAAGWVTHFQGSDQLAVSGVDAKAVDGGDQTVDVDDQD